jgi:hypothetical protein
MTLKLTITILVAALVLGLAANLMSRKRPEPGQVRLIPYLGIQFICLAVVVIMLAHLIGLLTGTPLTGRMGF